jgi:hypothetical protein
MKKKLSAWTCSAIILVTAVVVVAGGELTLMKTAAAASSSHVPPGQTPSTIRPTRPRAIGSGITENFLIFDVSLACDYLTVAANGGNVTAARFATIGTLAWADRIFARQDFFLGATIRLRPAPNVTCFADRTTDPFYDRPSFPVPVYGLANYRASLPPSDRGALTHVIWKEDMIYNNWIGLLGSGGSFSAAGYASHPMTTPHVLAHLFGAFDDGDTSGPCGLDTVDSIMHYSPAHWTDQFSECSRLSIGNYVASISPDIYELSLDTPPIANARVPGDTYDLVGPGTVILDGSASSDNSALEYWWEPDGACNISFAGFPGTDRLGVTFLDSPPTFNDVRKCRFLLTVTDSVGQVSYDVVTINQSGPPVSANPIAFSDSMDTLTNWTRSGGTSTGNWHQAPGVAEASGCTTECKLTLNKNVNATGTVTLSFKAGLTGMTGTGDYLKVDVLKGTTWYQVKSITGSNLPNQFSVNVSQYGSSAMKIRFRAKMGSTSKKVTIDNVSISKQ